ncbi:MAG TPA: flagellar biosynthetic protein FliO [Conexibacter sp.]|nr:flagellar biosynthetic protein FliO [Conexibacter sp.]
MIKASLLTRVAATVAAVALPLIAPASARAAAKTGAHRGPGESTPVDLTGASNGGAHIGGGGSIVRTIVGLAIVIGVIYGVAWVFRQVKAGRQPRATGAGLAALASVPLGSGRSVHLVRAGSDLVLLGVAEQGVVPIRSYTQEEARAANLVDEDGMLLLPDADDDTVDRTGAAPRRPQLPKLPQLALPSSLRAAREAARAGLPAPAARSATPRPHLQLPAPRNALDQLRSWTVRG